MTESNENNNVLARSISIVNLPGLVVEASISPALGSIIEGENLSWSARVENIGGTTTGTAAGIGVYRSQGRSFSPGSDVFIDDFVINSLGAGASTQVATRTIRIPSSAVSATTSRWVLVVADDGNSIVEGNENNNVLAAVLLTRRIHNKA